jgi:membrane fusion protein (multidrug efflux system)
VSEQAEQGQQGQSEQGEQTAQISGTVTIVPQGGAGQQGGGQPSAKPQGSKNYQGQPEEATSEDELVEAKSNKKGIIIAVVVLLAIVAGLFYWHSTYSEGTDDAQVDGDIYQVSARVSGQVVKVYVEDNQQVQAGQPLAEIDPKDYQVAVDQAQANLASAEADYEQAKVNVPITNVTVATNLSTTSSDVTQSGKQVDAAKARVDEAKANATKAQLDVDRYTPLVQRDVISKQQYDAAVAAAIAAKSQVLETQADVVAAEEGVRQAQLQSRQSAQNAGGQRLAQQAKADGAAAVVRQQQAKLEQAQLNLSYTQILAPATGIVNKKSVVVGDNLGVGQDLLSIIPLDDLWVTANFKETQLAKMKAGQKVTLSVDALGGRKYQGVVTQIGGATGSKLSLFPPENATGNYVKVVQRIPVRIDFTDLKDENQDHALRIGFSVTPKVSVK